MTTNVIPLRPSTVALAREVVRYPDHHSDAAVLDACETLASHGDWIDQSRACELRRAIIRETVDRLNVRACRAQRARRRIIYAAMFVAGLFIGFHL